METDAVAVSDAADPTPPRPSCPRAAIPAIHAGGPGGGGETGGGASHPDRNDGRAAHGGAFLDYLTAVLTRKIYIRVGAVRCGAPAARPARSARLATPRCRRPWAKVGPIPTPAPTRSGDRRKPWPSPGARRPRPPSGRWHSRGSATRTFPPVVLGAGTIRRRR